MSKFRIVTTCIIVLILVACNPATPIPSPTPEPTPTLQPTATTRPTLTPTATVEPPSILSEYLTNVQVVKLDNFNNLNGWSTYDSQTGILSEGLYKITGHGFWSGGLARKDKFGEGEGLMLEFKYDKGTEFEFILDEGEWQADSYRRFGVYGFGYPQANLTQGKNAIGYKNLHGNFSPKADTWYKFMVGVGFEGNFIALIWDPTDPSKVITYKESIGEKWDNGIWGFTAKAAYDGMNLYVDNFAEISFTAIK